MQLAVRISYLLLIAGTASLLWSCGGGSSSTTASNLVMMQQGNWQFSATSPSAPSSSPPTYIMGGHLTQDGTAVKGTLYVFGQSCIGYDPRTSSGPVGIPVTGTASSNGVEFDVAIGAGTFHISLPSRLTGTPLGAMIGTYSIRGGCADGDSGLLTASIAPDLSGTWVAQFDSGHKITLTLVESKNPDSAGVYPLTSASLTFEGTPGCNNINGQVYITNDMSFFAGSTLYLSALSFVQSAQSPDAYSASALWLYGNADVAPLPGQPTTLAGLYSAPIQSIGCFMPPEGWISFTKQ